MADNVTLPGAGRVIMTEQVGGVDIPVSKIRVGAQDADGGDVTVSNPFPVMGEKPATPVVTGVASSATSVTIINANAARLGLTVVNDSTSSTLYMSLGTGAASIASGGYTVALVAGAYWELPFRYTGKITGIWASALGYANVTEITA